MPFPRHSHVLFDVATCLLNLSNNNTGSIRYDLYLTSRKNSLELIPSRFAGNIRVFREKFEHCSRYFFLVFDWSSTSDQEN